MASETSSAVENVPCCVRLLKNELKISRARSEAGYWSRQSINLGPSRNRADYFTSDKKKTKHYRAVLVTD